jgi:predicted nuclease of predicted toxin-antitoxin system
MIRLFVDANLPIALARFLSEKGFGAVHAIDVGLETSADEVIWQAAIQHTWTIITKDRDFLDKVLQADFRAEPRPNLVLIRLGNTRNHVLLGWFAAQLDAIVRHLASGEQTLELGL